MPIRKLQPMEILCWSRLELHLAESRFSIRTCEPVGDPHWNSLFLKHCTPRKGPMLDQFVKSCCPWEGLTLVKYVENCLHKWHFMLELEKSMRGKEDLRQVAISWPESHLPSPCAAQEEKEEKLWVSLIMGRMEGWRHGVACFNLCCFSSSYSTSNGQKIKLIFPKQNIFFKIWR